MYRCAAHMETRSVEVMVPKISLALRYALHNDDLVESLLPEIGFWMFGDI